MSATFSVEADPARDLIRLRLSGFLTPEVSERFFAAHREAIGRLRCGPNRHATVADARDMAIQTQDVVGRFQAMLADPALQSRRLAVVTPSTLARMQTHRAIGDRNARFFSSLAEAEAWAVEPDPAA